VTDEISENAAALVPAPTSMPTWAEQIEWVSPDDLVDHHLWRELLGPEPPEREQELIDFMRAPSAMRIVVVTGAGCASPPGTILDGHRFRHAATGARVKLVMIIRRTDLTADAEEVLLVKAALSSQHVRRLLPSKLAILEHRLFLAHRRIRGHRTDLETSVGSSGSSPRPDTLALVSAEAGQPRNAVANRAKAFFSPISPAFLRDAVDRGTLSETAAADAVRAAETSVTEVVKLATKGCWSADDIDGNDILREARAKLEARVREKLGKPRRQRGEGSPEIVELTGGQDGDVLHADGRFAGRCIRVEVRGAQIKIMHVKPPKPGPEERKALSTHLRRVALPQDGRTAGGERVDRASAETSVTERVEAHDAIEVGSALESAPSDDMTKDAAGETSGADCEDDATEDAAGDSAADAVPALVVGAKDSAPANVSTARSDTLLDQRAHGRRRRTRTR
jgi:hypothetical protein